MIFSTFIFTLLFLPTVFAIYFCLNRIHKESLGKLWLVLASLFFYWYGSPSFFPFFMGSIIFNYFCGVTLNSLFSRRKNIKKKIVLTLGILLNTALLGYYKYTDFFIANYNFFTDSDYPLKNILLPIGISFFTFQLIAYLVDSSKGETGDYKIINYLMFITFFPQLIVGPIVHHKEVVPQYVDPSTKRINFDNISVALFLFFLGCSKKLIIADTLTPIAQTAFDHLNDLSVIDAWLAPTSYTISYYFDLSGYADMAIGIGLMFNIKIPINFNSPYKSRNFAEYWNRWHITLSRFLGDYIFRSVKKKGGSSLNFYFAIFVTFLVSGFWHGAGWNFVVWGIVNGLFVISAYMMRSANLKLPFIIAWGLTFAGVVGTRLLFVSSSVHDAIIVFKKAISIHQFSLDHPYSNLTQVKFTAIGLIITLLFPNSNELRDKFRPRFRFAVATTVLILIALTNMGKVEKFLYFQF